MQMELILVGNLMNQYMQLAIKEAKKGIKGTWRTLWCCYCKKRLNS
jgi:hypothetical protein